MVIFTSICANYIHKARTLAQSVKAQIPDAKMILCLAEREILPSIPADYFDEIVLAKDAWEGNFDRFIFKHTIVEASTAVKGQFFRYLMDRYPEEDHFIYLDPDIYVYSDFIELRKELEQHSVVLCPHLLNYGNIDMELSSTAHGVYNLGFLAISRRNGGRACIDWWAERLYLFCYDDIQRGIFTDQKWFDLAPCFFDVKILKHHGYDFAPWSLLNSTITKQADGYHVNGDPLRFIHFSGFGASAENCMEKWLPKGEHLFRTLYAEYAKVHDGNDADGISGTKWGYASYESGEPIENAVRQAYRADYDIMFLYENPFQHSNAFYRDLMKLSPSGERKELTKGQRRLAKAKKIFHEEGLAALINKCVRWILGK